MMKRKPVIKAGSIKPKLFHYDIVTCSSELTILLSRKIKIIFIVVEFAKRKLKFDPFFTVFFMASKVINYNKISLKFRRGGGPKQPFEFALI